LRSKNCPESLAATILRAGGSG